jgi:hypothetical protein
LSDRKQRVYEQLAELEDRLNRAEPDSLDWAFWCEILETVERLPQNEETAWKQQHIAKLRTAVKEVQA